MGSPFSTGTGTRDGKKTTNRKKSLGKHNWSEFYGHTMSLLRFFIFLLGVVVSNGYITCNTGYGQRGLLYEDGIAWVHTCPGSDYCFEVVTSGTLCHLLTHSLIYSITHSLNHSLTYLLNHSLIYSLTHSLTHLFTRRHRFNKAIAGVSLGSIFLSILCSRLWW